jgi:hypothetical protein
MTPRYFVAQNPRTIRCDHGLDEGGRGTDAMSDAMRRITSSVSLSS